MTVQIKNTTDLKSLLANQYMKQINNFFNDEKQALKFLSAAMAAVQRNEKLLECTPESLVNSLMIMAQWQFMPSDVSGEAYILPYNNNKNIDGKWVKVMEAQFQLGYQGLVTLFYRAGVTCITSGIVRKKDKVRIVNGKVEHEIDITLSKEERGEAIGAYVIVTFRGEENHRYMNGKDIIAHAQKFSKSYNPKGTTSPWNPANDPELTMWMKTVLKQHSKLLPKSESLNQALNEDHKDSIMSERLEKAKTQTDSLKMGNFLKHGETKNETAGEKNQVEAKQPADSVQVEATGGDGDTKK